MCKKFLQVDVPIGKVQYSPTHPTAGSGKYLKEDCSQKPNPGMIQQALKDLAIDLTRSLLIGDKVSDTNTGVTAVIGANIMFDKERPYEKCDLSYQLFGNLHESTAYLQRGLR